MIPESSKEMKVSARKIGSIIILLNYVFAVDENCAICQLELEGNFTNTSCFHKFHGECLFDHLKNGGESSRCPICREILDPRHSFDDAALSRLQEARALHQQRNRLQDSLEVALLQNSNEVVLNLGTASEPTQTCSCSCSSKGCSLFIIYGSYIVAIYFAFLKATYYIFPIASLVSCGIFSCNFRGEMQWKPFTFTLIYATVFFLLQSFTLQQDFLIAGYSIFVLILLNIL